MDARARKTCVQVGFFLALFVGGPLGVFFGIAFQNAAVLLGVPLGVFALVYGLVAVTKTHVGAKAGTLFVTCFGAPGAVYSLLLGAWPSFPWGMAVALGLSVVGGMLFASYRGAPGHYHRHGYRQDWQANFGQCLPVGVLMAHSGVIVGAVGAVSVTPFFLGVVVGVPLVAGAIITAIAGGVVGGFGGIYLTPIIAEFLFRRD